MPEGAVYVYGIVAARDAPAADGTGVEGAEVRTVEGAGLAALVSDLAGGALAAAREVRAHWQVLDHVARTATVLPLRFGTVMENDEAVIRRMLEPNAERLTTLLESLQGHVQVNVKGDYDEQRLLRDVVAGSSAVAALRERVNALPADAGYYDRIRLGELVAAEVGRHREHDTALALQRLEPLAAAARAEPPRRPEAALDLAFLVPRDRIDAFSRAVAALGTEVGDRIALQYVGPMPPYSFADAELTTEAATWG